MTIKKDCPICKRPTVHLYTAPGGAMVCHRCLAIPKALNLAHLEGVPDASIQEFFALFKKSNDTGRALKIPGTLITPAFRRFMDSFLEAMNASLSKEEGKAMIDEPAPFELKWVDLAESTRDLPEEEVTE